MIYVISEEVGIVHGVQTLDLEVTYFIAGTDSTNIANVYLLDDPPRGKARDQRYNDSSYFGFTDHCSHRSMPAHKKSGVRPDQASRPGCRYPV